MAKNILVSVVLPTYNESSNITKLINKIHQSLASYSKEIIVVDDNSPDKTWEIAKKIKGKDVKVIRRINNRGLVKSIRRGIDSSKGRYVVWMDADLSMPPQTIPKMVAQLEKYDIAVGSRYIKGGKDKRPFIRIMSSRLINLIANIILNFKVLDYDSGFVAARKDVLNKIKLKDAVYGEYCIEFLYKAGKKGYTIKEVPYSFIDRKAGTSKTAETLYNLGKYGLIYLKRIVSSGLK